MTNQLIRGTYIRSTVERINRAADSGNSGAVTWADDALATAVESLLVIIEAQAARIDALEAKVSKRVVAIGNRDGITQVAQEFQDTLEAQRAELLAVMAEEDAYRATMDAATNRYGY